MGLTELHAQVLSEAFEELLDKAESGAMAFVRFLTPDVVDLLAKDKDFTLAGWQVRRVGDQYDLKTRSITADQAVELRESKSEAVLLLVDTESAGSGMDGIYGATREVGEVNLLGRATSLAAQEITRRVSRGARVYAERAIQVSQGFGQLLSVSRWTQFDFLVRVAAEQSHPGDLLYMLGLWPVSGEDDTNSVESLTVSRRFVDRLLGTSVAGMAPAQRIDALKLDNPSENQIIDLHRFLRLSATRPLNTSLAELADQKHLWVNALQIEGAASDIQSIEIVSWRTRAGKISRWSGLSDRDDSEAPPELILSLDAHETGNYAKLEVRWKARPDNLVKDSVEYQVVIMTDQDEELSSKEVAHTGNREEKCRFTDDDFSMLPDDAIIGAKVELSVIGNDVVERQETEEFIIRFGTPSQDPPSSTGKKVRTFSEGVIELGNREAVSTLASSTENVSVDSKGYVVLRVPQYKSFRVFRPALIRDVEQLWNRETSGTIGRWLVKVRTSGERASEPEFVPFTPPDSSLDTLRAIWARAASVSKRVAERFEVCGGGVGQIYDDQSKTFDTVVKEYLLAWAALLEQGDPSLALANTVEVQSLSGRTIGLIVLPSHPLRMAWHVAYDNLVFHAAFEQSVVPKQIREEFQGIDGAMFPAFLPGLKDGSTFVFADTLGFHALGMVPDDDKEPKASLAILTRTLGESEVGDTAPTAGKQSPTVLGDEIFKYIECHNTSNVLHVHALRPGDGFTVARALGRVRNRYTENTEEEGLEQNGHSQAPAFVLELYPSDAQRGVSGRFIAEAREKRRRGAGVLDPSDQWMLESLSLAGGVNLPRLSWARKSEQDPKAPAHLAVAFDTFESRVVVDQPHTDRKSRPLFTYGMIAFFEREYTTDPSPLWRSTLTISGDGEKHPSDRTHTERLVRLHQAVQRSVVRSIGDDAGEPTLITEISYEKEQSLRQLHRMCDWVITLDRNAGIEYFDSPQDNKEIYEAYVIDCVPEREDLGCLQMITSTSNIEEVRILLDDALDQMGLSRSRRNAEFLMEHLKALSGRLAIRLTGQKTRTSELIALAMCHANCEEAASGTDCWTPLSQGFLVPVDDVIDLIPPLHVKDSDDEDPETTVSATRARPDLIYVSVVPRKGLLFQFIEVKYRQDLRAARSPEILERIRRQVESIHKRWDVWYSGEGVAPSIRAIRIAKLARVLRFYADKSHRHYLPKDRYEGIVEEIDQMVAKVGTYSFAAPDKADRGWVFCPEYAGPAPVAISPEGWGTRIFLFGPHVLPHSDFPRDTLLAPSLVELSDGAPTPAATVSQPEHLTDAEEETSPDEPQTQMSGSSDPEASTSHSEPSLSLGTQLFTGSEVRWPLTVKGNPHLLLAGLPGMGKTTCLLNLCKQMLDVGVRPIVFSYHQDIDDGLTGIANSVRFIDFQGLGFNPLQVIDRVSRFAYLDVAGAMRDIFVAIYPELGDVQGEQIRKAIKEAFTEQGWDDPNADLSELPEPSFRRFVDILRADPKPDRGLRTLLGRLEELDDYKFFDIAESHESLWDSDQPIVIRIHSTQNDNLQKAFASLVFYGLYKDMFRRGIQQKITHAIIFDEAHRAARLQLIPTMAKECRKYGISLVLASQEAKDFNVSIFSAIANYLVLRLNEPDAKALVRNVSSSDRERMLVDKIKGMDRFKGIYFSEGEPPSLVSLPLL